MKEWILTFLIIGGCNSLAAWTNVLFVIADDLSAEAIGSYGNDEVHTPNIDRLAAEGVLFARAYSQFPICGPARASLFTGLYPESLGITNNESSDQINELLGDRKSLPEYFRKDGNYYTARTGKIYHMRVPGDITAGVSGADHTESWSEYFNFQALEWMTEGKHTLLTNEKLIRDPDGHYDLGFGGAFYVVETEGEGDELHDARATDQALALMKGHADKPFFLAVGYVRPHVPLVAPEAYHKKHPHHALSLPPEVVDDWSDIPEIGITKNSKAIGLYQDDDRKRKVLSAYYASVSFIDAQVGRLLDGLDALNLREKTIVVFISDHGYHLGEHDLWQKKSLREESVRVPLVISAPGHSPSRSDSLVELVDLYPTLVELVEMTVPSYCEGQSLVPILIDPHRVIKQRATSYNGKGHLLRTDRWAYMQYLDGAEELYDMKTDEHQFINLASSSESSPILENMREVLDNTLSERKAP